MQSRSLFVSLAVALAACGRPTLDTRTFDLHYLRGYEATQLLGPYVYADRPDAKGQISYTPTAVTVRETSDNLDKIARVLAQYDHPKPLVRLTFHLIQADGAVAADPAISDVEPTLRKLFRYRGYRMVEEGIFSATDGGEVHQSMGGYNIAAELRGVAGVGDSATIDLGVRLSGRDVSFATTVGLPIGKTAVLGNVGEDPRGTLILTVRAELISVAP
ncbi:MAG TPA: hypothetical protein VNG95_02680 [Gemmatimonadales bacterium]|nr:hypothetical protein [Gemmatimonadales bacterium]